MRSRWWKVVKSDRLEADVDGPEADVVRKADVRRAIARLSPRERLVVVLYFYLDLPLDEVAAVTRSPLGTVKSRIHRAAARLRPLLDPEEVNQA